MTTANELIAEAAQHPTYDELLARDPRTLTREDRAAMIAAQRQERAAWQSAEDKKAAKKEAKKQEKEAA